MKVVRVVVLLPFLFLGGVALGGSGSTNPHPCRYDMQRFCSDTRPGGMRMLKCLESNRNDLSPNCKAQFDSAN